MPTKSKVAILRTKPETVLTDYQRLFELGGGAQALKPDIPTIIKDNISWHFPMPGANTTPVCENGKELLPLFLANTQPVPANGHSSSTAKPAQVSPVGSTVKFNTFGRAAATFRRRNNGITGTSWEKIT